jgi:hypothetical protein
MTLSGTRGGDNFVLITTQAAAEAIRTRLKSRFDEEVLSHYNFIDRQLGHIVVPGQGGGDDPDAINEHSDWIGFTQYT